MHDVALVFAQEQFDEFARLSGDTNPIHVDPAFAAKTRFGRTVAHGMFLFSVMNAELARRGLTGFTHQDLMFSGPTYAGEPMTLTLEPCDGGIEETLRDTAGETVTDGRAMRVPPPPPDEVVIDPQATIKGLEVGMTATRRRSFTRSDVDSFCALVDDPTDYEGRVPVGLIGGLISAILGVELPGRGTNWLKQHYAFLAGVPIDAEVVATVMTSRIRPNKQLVNLSSVCETSEGPAIVGESLVLVRDAGGSRDVAG